MSSMRHRVFISVRLSEALEPALALKSLLESCGIPTFLCDVAPGGNIKTTIVKALDGCDLAVIMSSKTCGLETTASFSTYQEMEYIIEERKPYFLVKMCERFDVSVASVAYFPWIGEGEVPDLLLKKIIEKLNMVETSKFPTVYALVAQAFEQAVHSRTVFSLETRTFASRLACRIVAIYFTSCLFRHTVLSWFHIHSPVFFFDRFG